MTSDRGTKRAGTFKRVLEARVRKYARVADQRC